MSDKLPFGGSPNNTPNKPKRLLYQQPSWTLSVGGNNLTDLEYGLRVGAITEAEYDAKRRESAALNPARRKAVVVTPRAKS